MICAYRWRDKYAIFFTFDEPRGPFDSLSKAIASYELNDVTEAAVEILSTELSTEQIAKTLRSKVAPPYSININEETWILNNKRKFVRKD